MTSSTSRTSDEVATMIARRPSYSLLSPLTADQWIDEASNMLRSLAERLAKAVSAATPVQPATREIHRTEYTPGGHPASDRANDRADELLRELSAGFENGGPIVSAELWNQVCAYVNEQPNNDAGGALRERGSITEGAAGGSPTVRGLNDSQRGRVDVLLPAGESGPAPPFNDAGVEFDPNRFGTGVAGDPNASSQACVQPTEHAKLNKLARSLGLDGAAVQPIPREADDLMLAAMADKSIYRSGPDGKGDYERLRIIWRAGHDAFTKSAEP